jgi:hypothetical protein
LTVTYEGAVQSGGQRRFACLVAIAPDWITDLCQARGDARPCFPDAASSGASMLMSTKWTWLRSYQIASPSLIQLYCHTFHQINNNGFLLSLVFRGSK